MRIVLSPVAVRVRHLATIMAPLDPGHGWRQCWGGRMARFEGCASGYRLWCCCGGLNGFALGNYHYATRPGLHGVQGYLTSVGAETLLGGATGGAAGHKVAGKLFGAITQREGELRHGARWRVGGI